MESLLFDAPGCAQGIFDRAAMESCWRSFAAGDLSRRADVEHLIAFAQLDQLIRATDLAQLAETPAHGEPGRGAPSA